MRTARILALPATVLLLGSGLSFAAAPAALADDGVCVDGDGHYPDPADLGKFYHCSNGIAYHKDCPADLHWSVEFDRCEWPHIAAGSLAKRALQTAVTDPAEGTSHISVALSAGPAGLGLLGGDITYTVTVTGADTVEPGTWTMLNIKLPAGMTFVSGSNENETTGCDPQHNIGAECYLEAGSGHTATETFTAHADLVELGSLTATATTESDSPTADATSTLSDSTTCTALTSLLIVC